LRKELSQDDIVKGFEVDKDEYVELTDNDFKKAEAAIENRSYNSNHDFVKQTKSILNSSRRLITSFRKRMRIISMFYARGVKEDKKMVGVARMVFRDREHLAAIKPDGRALMLDHHALLPNEINEGDKLDIPTENAKVKCPRTGDGAEADWDDEWKVQSR